jgi:hypothetical protein
MSLTYVPVDNPRPFIKGEIVSVCDRSGESISVTRIQAIGKRRVYTRDGRKWTMQGEFFDGAQSWPFPTIRIPEFPCPDDVESASLIFDPTGYDKNDCAGCGCKKTEHRMRGIASSPAS